MSYENNAACDLMINTRNEISNVCRHQNKDADSVESTGQCFYPSKHTSCIIKYIFDDHLNV